MSGKEQLAALLAEMNVESDRGLALVALSAIDGRLRDTLAAFMLQGRRTTELLDGRNAALGSLSARASGCLALGLIERLEFNEIEVLRKIRNRFAHDLEGAQFEAPSIRQLCLALRTPLPEFAPDLHASARFRFSNASSTMIIRLETRPAWVALERRTERIWIKPEEVRWRTTATEGPPPAGRTAVGLFNGRFKLIGDSPV